MDSFCEKEVWKSQEDVATGKDFVNFCFKHFSKVFFLFIKEKYLGIVIIKNCWIFKCWRNYRSRRIYGVLEEQWSKQLRVCMHNDFHYFHSLYRDMHHNLFIDCHWFMACRCSVLASSPTRGLLQNQYYEFAVANSSMFIKCLSELWYSYLWNLIIT